MKAVVFLGPTLPLAEAREYLDATYLPPAAQADVLSAVTRDNPAVIGLIDGEFLQSRSVWHKEILFALHFGVRVYGASSMGALRAVEMARYGMIGVGEVYRLYASGELTDDADVAVAYGTTESRYRPLSEPVVNILATLRLAGYEGLVDDYQQRSLLAIARSIYFPERTLQRFFRQAAATGFPPHILDRLSVFFSQRYVDVKRRDSILLLETIRDLDTSSPPPIPDFHFERSFLFEALYARDRRVRHDDIDIALSDITAWTVLHHPDFTDLNFSALNRAAVGLLGALLDLEASSEEVARECSRFRSRRGLAGPADFAEWLERNHLSADEFRALMTEIAICRMVHHWLLIGQDREGSTRTLLDELRLRGWYEDCVRNAAEQEQILRAEHVPLDGSETYGMSTRELVKDHLAHSDCAMDVAFPIWAYEAGFETLQDLRLELIRSRTARRRLARLSSLLLRRRTDGSTP